MSCDSERRRDAYIGLHVYGCVLKIKNEYIEW